MRWTLGATLETPASVDLMMTSLSTLPLHATVRKPLGPAMLTYCSVKLPRRDRCLCVFYYCRTYYKAVRVGGERIVEDMCYERRRAEACAD